MNADLPQKFVRLMSEMHGEEGNRWLARLPEIIRELETDWELSVVNIYQNLSYHFVASCELINGGKAVLKIAYPEADSPIFNEAAMLKIYGGRGAIRLLRINEKYSTLLLEKLIPGTHLKSVFHNDLAKSIETAIKVLEKIKRKPPKKHNFPHLDFWFANFMKAAETKFPQNIFNKALETYQEISKAEKFLLHGDFHHENILSAEHEEFLVIDPKGIVGPIGYEISVFLNNHAICLGSTVNLQAKLDQAVLKFSEAFDISPRVLKKWAFVQAVLSAWWTFEDNGADSKVDLELAKIWNN